MTKTCSRDRKFQRYNSLLTWITFPKHITILQDDGTPYSRIQNLVEVIVKNDFLVMQYYLSFGCLKQRCFIERRLLRLYTAHEKIVKPQKLHMKLRDKQGSATYHLTDPATGEVVSDSRNVAPGRFGVVPDMPRKPIPAPALPNARLRDRR